MSKTRKNLIYSAVMAVIILLSFVAVTFMTAPDGQSYITESGQGQDILSTVNVNPSDDSGYNELDVVSELNGPGSVADNDKITNNVVSGAEPISNAQQLDAALKTNGKYYLTGNIDYTASTGSAAAATSGTFGGVLYGNGYTVTVTVNEGKYNSSDYKNYGFLVKTLSGGTIRDLNLVVAANGSVSFGKVITNRSKLTMNVSGGESVSQYVMQIGGIAGEMTGGLIHNCTVRYTGNIRFIIDGTKDTSSSSNAYGGDNVARIFGGMVGGMSGGMISYSTLKLDGEVYNAGMQTDNGTNHMFVLTGGIAGVVEGAVNFRKIAVEGNGKLIGQANVYRTKTIGSGRSSTDAFTGALIGYVTGYGAPNINGVYLNLTYSSSSGDSDTFEAAIMSSGFTGAVKTYYTRTNGVVNPGYKNQYDSRENDDGGNVASSTDVSEMRTSYGIGAVETSGINNVTLNNVYVSQTMDNVIKNHHPYAIHEIQYGQNPTANYKWVRWNWTYTVIDASTLGNTAVFAPTTAISNTAAAADVSADTANQQRGVYFRLSGQGTNNFVFSINQGTDSVYDIYECAEKTYDKSGTVYVPVMYAGYKSNVKSDVRRDGMNLTDSASSTVSLYANTVKANSGSYLYMDIDMSRAYSGTDRFADGYQGSGDSYIYTYNGDMLYVPAIAGYKTSYGTGEKINFTEDELNELGLSSTNFSLSSSNTIVNSGNVNYELYNYLHWNGAGNVGTYSMTFNRTSSSPVFTSKDGANYYCAFKESYPSKTVEVEPFSATLDWASENLVYDGTVKDVSATFAALPSGNALGNNDSANLGVAISYSALNENLLLQNKPYHAGDYTAKASLTYGSTTENPLTGNYTLSNAENPFTVSKVTMTLTPEDVTSRYGDDHSAVLQSAKVSVSGDWVGTDADYFLFTAKTVDDTINFATLKGEYPTTVEPSLTEGAVAELLTDYEFSVNQGKLIINERPINGTLTISGGVYNGSEYRATLKLDEGVRVSTDAVYNLDYLLGEQQVSLVRNAGEYIVRITPEENKYAIGTIIIEGKDELYAYGETKLVVEQRNVDITLSFDNGYVYDGGNKVTSVSVQAQEGDAGVLAGEDAQLTMLYNGETEAVLPQAYTAVAVFGNTNYKAGTVSGAEFTVERADLRDIIIDSAETVYDGNAKNIVYTLVGVADEENISELAGNVTVTYNKSTTAPVNAGVYDVEITVAEGKAYNAKSISATFTVNKAAIQFNPKTSTVYTGKNIQPEYSITAPGMEDASSLKSFVTASHSVILNASTYDVTLSFAGTNNYEAKEETFQLEVRRATLGLTADDGQTFVYSGKAQAPVYNIEALFDGDEYGEVTLTVSGDKAENNQAVKAGSYSLTIDIARSVNYEAASLTVNFTIEKYVLDLVGALEQFVTVITEGDTDVTEIARYLPSLDVLLVDDTGVYSNENLVYTTKVNGTEATDITFADGKGTFTADIAIDGLDTENYEFNGVTVTVNVLDASITITVNGEETTVASVTFGDALDVAATGSYGGSEPAPFSDVTWYSAADDYTEALADQPTDAGSYMAVFKYTFGPDSNYVTRSLFLTVSPKEVTVTLDGSGMNVVYGDEITFDGATYYAETPELTIEYSAHAHKFSEVGSYALSGTVTAVADGKIENYVFNVVNGTFDIKPRTVYVKAGDVSVSYGDEVIFSNYTVYSDDGVTVWEDYGNAAQLKVNFSVQDGILVAGSYDITVNAENVNYDVKQTTTKGVLTVNKRDIVITVDRTSVVYGTTELPALKGSITGGSLINGDTLGALEGIWKNEVEALGTLDAGNYRLTDYADLRQTLNSQQTGENYNITFDESSELVVTPKTLGITFTGWQSDGVLGVENTVMYNALAWTPSAQLDGVINDDDVKVVCVDESEIKNAGAYSRELVIGGADAKNYVAASYTATLEILPYKTEISVGAGEYTYTYGDVKTDIDPSIRVLEGDSEDGAFNQKNYVGIDIGITGVQVGWSENWNAGTYTVVISYSGKNYTADPVKVTVTVNKKVLSKVDALSGGDLGTSVYNASNVHFSAAQIADLSAYAGLEDYIKVVYMLNGSPVSVVRNAGEYTIDLVMTENVNYEITGGGESLLNDFARYTVTKASSAELNFSLTYSNKLFDEKNMTDYIKSVIAVSGIGGEPVTGATLTLTVTDSEGGEADPVNSGVYNISVTATGMANYDDMTAASEAGTFTIDKVYVAVDEINLSDKTVTYNSEEQSLSGEGIVDNAVLKKVSYEYSSTDYLSETGAVNAGTYNVIMTVLFDKLNSRFSEGVSLETVDDPDFGEVYKYERTATLTIEKATPELTVDKNTLANYFDGYSHSIAFTLGGVGRDSAFAASYDASMGAGQTVSVEGLGTFEVRYYTDAAYANMLKDADGAATLPVTVLAQDGKTLPYYMQVTFRSENGNYADFDFRNNGYDMALYIMQSVVTLTFGSLSVPYGQLGSQSAANEYIEQNMKYTYTVNDEGSASVNYDPEAMLEISYNLTSFDVNTGTYEIAVNAVAAKTEFAGSVTAVVRNANNIKLNITPADVTDAMKATFEDVSDTYGNKIYTAADFAWTVNGILGEKVDYTVTYDGTEDFSISDAGEYVITVSIPEGNYKAWTGSVNLSIAKVGVDVVWTMGGNQPADGTFTKTYDGKPADIVIEVVGADGVTARCVYVNSEGVEIDAPTAVGTHTAKAVLSLDNYYVNEDCETVNVVIEAIVLDEETIKGWIKDDSDVYGSVQGIDITGLPEGFGATSIVYVSGDKVFDMNTIKNATAGVYTATVTVSNGSSSGSATFTYTVEKRKVVFTANLSADAGVKPTTANVSLTSDIALAGTDRASVTALNFTDKYNESLAFGVYDMKDYVAGITVEFNQNADSYEYTVVLGKFTVSPTKAPDVVSVTANYNAAEIRFEKEGLYAYKIGTRGTWITMSSPSDTLIVTGLKAETNYTIYVAYAGFTSVNAVKSATTTADPNVLSQMIDSILEGGLTLEEQEAYDNILAYYDKIAEVDRPEIQTEYDALVAQFNALKNDGGENTPGGEGEVDVLVIVVCSVCLLLIVVSISGVVVAAVRRKRRENEITRFDGKLL